MGQRHIATGTDADPIAKIISGGQTGADRGGLDAAIELGVPHGGWCPKGREAEDGRIPDRYRLIETASARYPVRTEQNVIDSHAMVVFTYGEPTGGSKATVSFAGKHGRPHLHVDLNETDDTVLAGQILEWLSDGGLCASRPSGPPPNPVLNVAGIAECRLDGPRRQGHGEARC